MFTVLVFVVVIVVVVVVVVVVEAVAFRSPIVAAFLFDAVVSVVTSRVGEIVSATERLLYLSVRTFMTLVVSLDLSFALIVITGGMTDALVEEFADLIAGVSKSSESAVASAPKTSAGLMSMFSSLL